MTIIISGESSGESSCTVCLLVMPLLTNQGPDLNLTKTIALNSGHDMPWSCRAWGTDQDSGKNFGVHRISGQQVDAMMTMTAPAVARVSG